MKVEAEKDTICVNRVVGQKNETVFVDGDVIIPDVKPDIMTCIHANGTVCLYKKELLDGKVRIDGSVSAYIMYLAEGEMECVRGLNASIDFTQIVDIPEAESGMDLDLEINLKNIECKILNGRKINVKAGLEIEVSVYANQNIQIVKAIPQLETVQTLEKKMRITSLVGVGETKAYAKDTLVMEQIDRLAEILNVEVRLMNQDQKISYNKVLAKSELNVNILYLTEDNRISSVQGVIPVMGFIDMPDVSETNLCDVKYRIKNMVIKPNEAEEHSIYIEVEVELNCRAYETKEINLIQDAYSPECNLTFTQKTVRTTTEMQRLVHTYNMREQISASELMGKKIYQVEAKNRLSRVSITNEVALYEGEIILDVLFLTEGNLAMENKYYHIPYEYTANATGVMNNCTCQTQIDMRNDNFVLMPDGNLDVKLDINFITFASKMADITIMDEMQEEENRDFITYSIVIYFVKQGDTLWEIAKRFRSTVEDIVKINEIEDENKIFPGERLLIPRYVVRKTRQTA